MSISRLFKRRGAAPQPEANLQTTIGKGILYLHMIIVLQVLFLLGLIVIIVVMGKVLMTPLWVFLLAFVLFVSGIVFIYRKTKTHVQQMRETLKHLNLSDRNHEISILGGMFSIRVENSSPRLPGSPPKQLSGAEETKEPTIQ